LVNQARMTKTCMRCQKEMDYWDDCPCLLQVSREIEAEADRRFRGESKPKKKGAKRKNESRSGSNASYGSGCADTFSEEGDLGMEL